MGASDLLVGKAGALTMAESFIHSLPTVIMKPLMPQEVANMKFMTHQGTSYFLKKPHQLGSIVQELLSNPLLLTQKPTRAHELAQPYAALDLADFVIEILRK